MTTSVGKKLLDIVIKVFFPALSRLSTAEAVVALEKLKILHIFDRSLVMKYWIANTLNILYN